jgi:hypothetical protein
VDGSDIKPSIWYYGLAILAIIIGFAVFAGLVFSSISDMGSGLVQMVAPGSADIDLKEPGEYTIYYEYQTYFKNKFYRTSELIPGIRIDVLEIATGRHLETYPAPIGFNYSLGSRNGRGIIAFKADLPGVYRINTTYLEALGPEVVLAVGKGFAEGILSGLLISFAALFCSIAVGAIIAFITYTRRKNAINQKKEEEKLMRGSG